MEENLPIDPFLQLLTDALRAGPGSPEWHEAVERVKTSQSGDGDEHAMLLRARENLASGKAYREVRAGAGFTRKVLAEVDRSADATNRKSPLSSNLISYLGAGLIVGTLAVIIFLFAKSGGGPVQPEDLTNEFFSKTIAAAPLDEPLEQTPMSAWRLIGPLKLDPAHNLAPALRASSNDFVGGAIVATHGVDPKKSFAVEATFTFQHVSDEVVPQLFVTDDPNFSADKATSPHELVWMVRGGFAQIALPNGDLTTGYKKIGDGQTTSVRIVIGTKEACVSSDGAILWSGGSQLSPDKPRYVGVRMLCRKDDKKSIVAVKDLRLMGK